MNATEQPPARPADELALISQRLQVLKQGDVITLGATNITGRGQTPTLREASPGAHVSPEQVWTLTLVSKVGWYVVLSQDCDIVRDLDTEPCLLVCPLDAVAEQDWDALRRGPYSPREFPFPALAALGLPAGTLPIANAVFVTSVDKAALVAPSFRHLPALPSAVLRERFASWLGRRAARAPHPDALEEHVLSAAGDRLRSLAKQHRQKKGAGVSAVQMLIAAGEEWFIGPGEQLVPLHLILTPSSAAAAGLWDNQENSFRIDQITQAAQLLAADLSKRATAGLGYVVTVEVHTLDRVTAAQYRTWSEWTWEPAPAWTNADTAIR